MQNEDLMKLLAALGGVIGLIEAILGFDDRNLEVSRVILLVLSIILAVIILVSIIVPHKFVELNWIICVVIGIVMIIYTSLIGGILVLIAGFVGYTER
ncbi:hypothetical protein LCGC14_0816130 [marine sediment metagenome]|uniref:Uncharacterized protein n=1 Tax=marine sediment metagenome TaxID=412755 RepID=A0A0F9PK63_9ZZZZ